MTPPPLTFGATRSPRRRSRYAVLAVLALPVVALVAVALLLVRSSPALGLGTTGLAAIKLPLGGGRVEHAYAFLGHGAEGQSVPVRVEGGQIMPEARLKPGQTVTVVVDIARPGWDGWLAGAHVRIRRTVVTPRSRLRASYLIKRGRQPLKLTFTEPVTRLAYGTGSATTRVRLRRASARFAIPVSAAAGTLVVQAAPRPWERAITAYVSWFPPGARATAIASPAPGSRISTDTPVTLTFNTPVSKALGTTLPPVSPAGAGTWRTLNAHTIRFVPAGYGYGLGAHVKIGLPGTINVVGGTVSGQDPTVAYTVPAGSTLRLQQLLAELGYLPVTFRPSGAGTPATVAAQQQAAINPPQGHFAWRYANTPGPLQSLWQAGTSGELTKGAVMAFENDQGLSPDGDPGPQVWKALIGAALKHSVSTFGYTFVHVTEGSPESEYTWHDGKTVASGAVNTGIAAAPTATGVFAVFEHLPVTTMTGTNPDGSVYHDPGIKWVSYFNGGDALHEYPRGSYGFPQSLGCVEMPMSEAAAVYPYTPIGTIVDVVP